VIPRSRLDVAFFALGKENNWITTGKDGQWFVIFRLYGPEKPFFDKTWVLPDVEMEK